MSESQNQPVQLDRKDLKIQALLERVTAQENQIADLRVEVTVLQQQLQEVISNAQQPPDVPQEPWQGDIVEGHVVEDVPKPQVN